MLETSFGLLFFLKVPENTAQKTRFVYMRITVGGTPREESTKKSVI